MRGWDSTVWRYREAQRKPSHQSFLPCGLKSNIIFPSNWVIKLGYSLRNGGKKKKQIGCFIYNEFPFIHILSQEVQIISPYI